MRNPSSAFVSQLAGILSSAPMWHQSGRAPLRRGLLPPIEPLRTPALLGWGWRRLGRRRPPTRPTCAHPPYLHRCRNQVGRGKNEAQFGKHGKPCRRDTRLAERMAASRMSGQGKQVVTRRHHSHGVDRTSGRAWKLGPPSFRRARQISSIRARRPSRAALGCSPPGCRPPLKKNWSLPRPRPFNALV